jgi:S1-C subfamily serine protease
VNWVDIAVLVIAAGVALLGARQGLVVALPSIVLLIAGVVVGLKLAPALVAHIDSAALRAVVSIAVPIVIGGIGETAGAALGTGIKRHIRSRKVTRLDNTLGALLQAAMVFVVAWLALFSLTALSGAPALVSAINDSRVLGAVNAVMPQTARRVPAELKKQLAPNGLPPVSSPFSRVPVGSVEAPDESLDSAPAVTQDRSSVLKIQARAPSCSRKLEGTGFVVAPQRVLTNAHVVAGTSSVAVETGNGILDARVVYFNPEVDDAILAVPGLSEPALDFASQPAERGQDAIVLGYPLDGPYTASPGRVRKEISLRGPDIYSENQVTRDVYTLRAQVHSGNSGGPLVEQDGDVLGVVFGAAVDDSDTGFALTHSEVQPAVSAAPGLSDEVSTGQCAE